MEKHTPTPWRMSPVRPDVLMSVVEPTKTNWDRREIGGNFICESLSPENLQFILRVVNSQEALLDAARLVLNDHLVFCSPAFEDNVPHWENVLHWDSLRDAIARAERK